MVKSELEKVFRDYGITGINVDSRKIKQGNAFFAVKGEKLDGNEYIDQALSNGAKLIVTENSIKSSDTMYLRVNDARIALSIAASIFYPNLPEHLIAVTGTNGKTSVVSYCQQLFSIFGQQSASIGTLGVIQNSYKPEFDKLVGGLTTPDSITFREILNDLSKNNINYVAFEASSHGIDQNRLYGLKVDSAAFTSFSQDHLDYHKTMDEYLQAKLKLFSDNLESHGIALINSEMPYLQVIREFLKKHNVKYVTVGSSGDVKINKTEQSICGQKINFTYEGKEYNFNSEIIGSFQATNLLIAAMLVSNARFAFNEVIKKLPEVKAVKGRLERVGARDDSFHIFVDYAHTPDALENSLSELRKIKYPDSKLLVVFGCGGDRDSSKRSIMGDVANHLADIIIVTDDNPRSEDPKKIRMQILQNVPKGIELGNREEAIIFAVNQLSDGDILLIAGKGHEEYQIIGDKKIPFSDVAVSKAALKRRKK